CEVPQDGGWSVLARRARTRSRPGGSVPLAPDVLVTRCVLGDGHAGDAVLGGAGVLGRGLVLRRLVLVHGRGDGLTCPLALRTVLALEDDDVVVRLHDQTEEARMGAHLVADAELAHELEMLLLRLALTAGHPQRGSIITAKMS